ncbi:hypothetical protein HYPSUDRAFT_206660 [Hypholoma sublateritium FD-334 SS-4]|uniref:Uncharacterized protein n=1 Tax=Hypholoma sublateritium (strain FD-334 SS-4) TaxID=945553 RepID=A0A0D2P931_HYPSF|nr:hypothetical protein HYPSUDRAFT_206660 [Hypholoma sublateritium FD-334 SS-4]
MSAQTYNHYGFRRQDYTWGKLRSLLCLEQNGTKFDKIADDLRCLELRYFTTEALNEQGQRELFELVKAELKQKQPTFFGGAHGDRCLSFVFGLIMYIHDRRRYRHEKRCTEGLFEAALSPTQTDDRNSNTATLSTSSSSQTVVKVHRTSICHSPRKRQGIGEKMRPVVLLTRRKNLKNTNTAARQSLHDTGALPQRITQPIDSVSSDDRVEFHSRESSPAQRYTGSERSASPAVENGSRDIHPELEMTTEKTVYSHPRSLEGDIAGPSTFRSMLSVVPGVKGPRRMPGPLDSPGLFYAFQLDNHSVKLAAPIHDPQLSEFSGSQYTNSSRLQSDNYFSCFGATSLYGPRWEPRKPDPSLSGDFGKKEKLEEPVAEASEKTHADPSSTAADSPFFTKEPTQRESGIAGIHRFLSKCHPPMMQYILRFVEFGCTTTEYLRGLSTWPPEQRHKLLVKILQGERGGPVPQMDIAVLENQLDTYFMEDDV